MSREIAQILGGKRLVFILTALFLTFVILGGWKTVVAVPSSGHTLIQSQTFTQNVQTTIGNSLSHIAGAANAPHAIVGNSNVLLLGSTVFATGGILQSVMKSSGFSNLNDVVVLGIGVYVLFFLAVVLPTGLLLTKGCLPLRRITTLQQFLDGGIYKRAQVPNALVLRNAPPPNEGEWLPFSKSYLLVR